MTTSQHATRAIAWQQTEIDGLEAAPLEALTRGVAWSWRGQAVPAGMPNEPAILIDANRSDGPISEMHVEITNGARVFSFRIVAEDASFGPFQVFDGPLPPRDEEFWVRNVVKIPAKVAAPVQIPGPVAVALGSGKATSAAYRAGTSE